LTRNYITAINDSTDGILYAHRIFKYAPISFSLLYLQPDMI